MKVLLDTHVVLWWLTDNPKLKAPARNVIASADLAWVSAASGWEIAIKRALGKLHITGSFAAMIKESDLDELSVTLDHVEALHGLPHHHEDPFDRLLVAQAIVADMTIVTHDRPLMAYDVPIVLA